MSTHIPVDIEELQKQHEETKKRLGPGYAKSKVANPEPFTKIPPPVTEKKPGQLTPEQIKQFFDEGFCVVTDYFDREELQPCLDASSELVEEVAQKLYKAGKIKSLYREYGVFQRLAELEKAYPGANILLVKMGKLPQAFKDLWSCEKLLNMNEQLIGPDIAGHPVWNLRPKTPKNEATIVPWHQDSAYLTEETYNHNIITAWIPFLDTHETNGGMKVIRNSHKKGVVATHTCCHAGTWYVMLDEKEAEEALGVNVEEDSVMCDVPFGGFLLFNNITVHCSLPNFSNEVRWSTDLRWQSPFNKYGFFDVMEGVVMRSSTDPNVKPDWDSFSGQVNRHVGKVQEIDEFDTNMAGPWMGRWDISNVNTHTEAFKNRDS